MKFDRERYEAALKQQDEAVTDRDYGAAYCALAAARGMTPGLDAVAKAFGLPRCDKAVREAHLEDVIWGRIPDGLTAAEVRDRYYVFPTATQSANGSGAVDHRWRTEADDDRVDESETERPWSDLTISVSDSAFVRIERELREAIWAFESRVETGGWLYSCGAPDDDEVRIIAATGPGAGAKHRWGGVRLAHPRELEAEMVPDATLIGDWHSHPAVGSAHPTDWASKGDEEAWGHRLETIASCSPWVGLIFAPGSLGWTTPGYHGFLTHRNEHGVVVCEQARVVEGSGWV